MFHLLLKLRNAFRRAVHQLLGLAQVEHRGNTVMLAVPGQGERLPARFQRAFGDLQFGVQFEQLKIIGRHLADDRGDDRLSVPVGIEQVGARGLGRAAQLSPEIEFERQQIETGFSPIAILVGDERCGQRELSIPRQPCDLDVAGGSRLRKLVGARNTKVRAGLIDPRDRIAEIVILHQSDLDQPLEVRVSKYLEPLELRQ